MKTRLLLICLCAFPVLTPAETKAPVLWKAEEILALKQVPPGPYEVTTLGPEKPGQPGRALVKLSLTVAGDSLKTEGTPGEFGAVTGRILPLGNGVFMVQLRGEGFMATQWWVFQADGDARIKEIPDRGENQFARRISK